MPFSCQHWFTSAARCLWQHCVFCGICSKIFSTQERNAGKVLANRQYALQSTKSIAQELGKCNISCEIPNETEKKLKNVENPTFLAKKLREKTKKLKKKCCKMHFLGAVSEFDEQVNETKVAKKAQNNVKTEYSLKEFNILKKSVSNQTKTACWC